VGTRVARVRTLGATSLFDGVTVGLVGAQKGCNGMLGRNSLALGTGPGDSLMLVASQTAAVRVP